MSLFVPVIRDRSYGDIACELAKFAEHVAKLGVTSSERLDGIIANIRRIDCAYRQGRAETFEEDQDLLRELVWSLVEGEELNKVYRAVRTRDSLKLKKLLKKALSGPLDPELEDSSKNIGRNTTFELRLAAAFLAAGADVTVGGIADLQVDHAGFRLFIECKRPLCERNIERRCEEACSQLKARFEKDNHANTIGLVALSITKALRGEKILSVQQEESIAPSLTADAQRARAQCRAALKNSDPRILGGIFYHHAPARVGPTQRLTAASQFDVLMHDNVDSQLQIRKGDFTSLLSSLT